MVACEREYFDGYHKIQVFPIVPALKTNTINALIAIISFSFEILINYSL